MLRKIHTDPISDAVKMHKGCHSISCTGNEAKQKELSILK
jgi:hypothetical protein